MPKQTYLNLCEIFDKNEKDVNEFLIQNNLNNSDLTYSRLNKLIKKKNKFYNFAIHSPLKTTKSIQSNGISVLDLFSGAGGFSLGFEKEGFDILASIESNKIFSSTHKINFPKSLDIVSHIENVHLDLLSDQINQKIDVIIGGPPCQTFSSLGKGKISSLGKKIEKDPRNFLYADFIRFVKFFSPKCFVMENVPGFQRQMNGKVFKHFLDLFEDTDYKINFKILNSKNFGVPQNRERLFIVGIKNQIFKFPDETHFDNRNNLFKCIDNNYVNVNDALNDLPVIEDDWRLSKMPYRKLDTLNDYQKQMRNGNDFVFNNICRISNNNAKEMFKLLQPNQKYKELNENEKLNLKFPHNFKSKIILNRCKRLPLDLPSWTIVAHIGMDGYEYIHPYENRTLSVREAARLQSFDDKFIFLGNMREQYLQVGNAVPPLVANALAKEIKSYF